MEGAVLLFLGSRVVSLRGVRGGSSFFWRVRLVRFFCFEGFLILFRRCS